MALFNNKYRIESTRAQWWDYGRNGAYFITICTKKKAHFYGNISNGKMHLSEIGVFAQKLWMEIPNHFSFVILDAFVIMPNHMHGIIVIDKPNNSLLLESANENNGSVGQLKDIFNSAPNKSIGQSRHQNQGKHTISSIIGSYKSIVTKNSRKINPDFGWQSLFHDHIIRDDADFQRISRYINNNVAKWNDDKFFE